MQNLKKHYDPWPPLSYPEFKSTGLLLHALVQMLGKLKLKTPFEPHWANVPLWVTSFGLTTGAIPFGLESFSIAVDLVAHQVRITTSWGKQTFFNLASGSVAALYQTLFTKLNELDITVSINPKPQEVPNPIPFNQDEAIRDYNPQLANTWWRILTSTYHVMQRYHSRFKGITPAIGLMWGTFDLRDVRYRNIDVPITSENADFLRRNAMDVMQIESGWWSGNEQYPRPAYYSFTFPKPVGLERSMIAPATARWDTTLNEFILDYDDLRTAKNPAIELLTFFDSTYNAGASTGNWEKNLIGPGVPV